MKQIKYWRSLEMNKAKFFQILYVILIIVVILAVIFLILWVQSESAGCLKDPLQFYADKMGSECYCVDPIK